MPQPPLPSPASADALVEEMGDSFDRMGSQRIAGRIVGWLLICEPSHQNAEEIRAAVKASKGSVSTVVRNLVDSGLVERIGLPGDRRTFYRIRDDGWTALFEVKMAFTHSLHQLARTWQERIGEGPGEERIAAMERLYSFFAREMEQVLERWRAEEQERREQA